MNDEARTLLERIRQHLENRTSGNDRFVELVSSYLECFKGSPGWKAYVSAGASGLYGVSVSTDMIMDYLTHFPLAEVRDESVRDAEELWLQADVQELFLRLGLPELRIPAGQEERMAYVREFTRLRAAPLRDWILSFREHYGEPDALSESWEMVQQLVCAE